MKCITVSGVSALAKGSCSYGSLARNDPRMRKALLVNREACKATNTNAILLSNDIHRLLEVCKGWLVPRGASFCHGSHGHIT